MSTRQTLGNQKTGLPQTCADCRHQKAVEAPYMRCFHPVLGSGVGLEPAHRDICPMVDLLHFGEHSHFTALDRYIAGQVRSGTRTSPRSTCKNEEP